MHPWICVYLSAYAHIIILPGCVWAIFKGLGVVLTCIGYKLALLPVALGWSCGAQRVGFDAGSEGKIRTQESSPKTYTHALAQSWWCLPADPFIHTSTPKAALPAARLQRAKLLSRMQKQLLVAAKHNGNTSGHSCCFSVCKCPESCQYSSAVPKSTDVSMFYLSTLHRCQRLKSLRHKIWLQPLQKDWCLQHKDFHLMRCFLSEWNSGNRRRETFPEKVNLTGQSFN